MGPFQQPTRWCVRAYFVKHEKLLLLLLLLLQHQTTAILFQYRFITANTIAGGNGQTTC
jgi:hypothetical protein